MTRTLRYTILTAVVISLGTMLFISGCEGVSGPRGKKGDIGPTGPDYVPPIPENRFFSLAITNSAMSEHNGAPKVYLSFDGEQDADAASVVSAELSNGDPRPSIDGRDEGVSEWAGTATEVPLRKAAGNYNFIETATVRSAFDNRYIYFQVQWTEVGGTEFGHTVGLSDDPAYIVYPADSTGNPAVWDYESGDEDRLLMLFEITDVTRFDVDGCLVTCHTDEDLIETNYHATRGGREFMDVWTWGAGLTNPAGYLRDQVMQSSRGFNIGDDNGVPVVISNQEVTIESDGTASYRRPIYQAVGDPNLSSEYPLWTWELQRLSTSGWQAGARIPAFISIATPSNSAGDVEAIGSFDEQTGTWTVGMRRLRKTGNGDDAQF